MSSIDMDIEIEASGKTHQGKVRDGNEDAMLVAPELGLFAVLDGMGGARAGEVASSTACDVLHDHVRAHKSSQQPAELIETAIRSANARVHREARDNRERHGMGTTVVACLFIDEEHALVAHVGDSRAYLWREGRMQLLTRDHTIVADLVAKNIITASEAEHHPYSNVLSRNLGSKSDVQVDVLELSLQPGDRLLLCSDGLTGYASNDAIAQILGGNDVPEHTAEDLIALALRGGGGDNVTAIVIDAGEPEVPHDTRIIRTSGAEAWWRRRQMFFEAARERGLCESPVCSVLSPDEALEIVAGNLCEAIFRDLEQTTGINVWTYAENLGRGWFDQDGSFMVLRNLIDILRYAADAVLADIATEGEPFATALDIAVTRALIVAEMAIGGLLAEKLRQIEAELVRLRAHEEVTLTGGPTVQHGFSEQPTVPCMPTGRSEPPPPEVSQCLTAALALAEEDVRKRSSRVSAGDCLQRAHMAALGPVESGDVELSAREMVSASLIEEGGISPLLDALDRARSSHFQAIRHTSASPEVRAAAMRRVAIAHRRMMTVVSGLVVEYGQPIIETLHNVTATTAELRSQVGKGEARLAELERRYASRKSPARAPRSQP